MIRFTSCENNVLLTIVSTIQVNSNFLFPGLLSFENLTRVHDYVYEYQGVYLQRTCKMHSLVFCLENPISRCWFKVELMMFLKFEIYTILLKCFSDWYWETRDIKVEGHICYMEL
jgi:hypothetical protein